MSSGGSGKAHWHNGSVVFSDLRGGRQGSDTKVLVTAVLGAVLFVICALVAMSVGVVPYPMEAPDGLVLAGLASAGVVAIATIALGGRFIAEPARFWPCVVAGGLLAGIGVAVAYSVMMGSGIVSTD